MNSKPDTCKKCPLYNHGKGGFVKDEQSPNAQVLILLPSPSGTDEREGKAGSGLAGEFLNQFCIPLAGLERGDEAIVGNMVKCYLPAKPTPAQKKAIDEGTKYCIKHHLSIPPSVKLIVSAGDEPLKYIAGLKPVLNRYTGKYNKPSADDWRGFFVGPGYQGKRVFCIKNPLKLRNDERMIIPTKSDFIRIGQILNGQWPQPVPERYIVQSQTPDFHLHYERALESDYVVIDTEYDTKGDTVYPGLLTLIGVLYKHPVHGIGGLQFPWSTYGEPKRSAFGIYLTELIRTKHTIYHNAFADIAVLNHALGITYPDNYGPIDDTMLRHAVLYSEWPHDLGFLESMHSKHDRMKHLGQVKDAELDYNWGDVLSTQAAYEHQQHTFQSDPQSEHIYRSQSLPLIQPRLYTKARGTLLDRQFLSNLFPILAQRTAYAQAVAEAYTGYPINLGSNSQLIEWLTKVEKVAVPKKRGKGYTVDEDAVAKMRRTIHDYDPDEEKDGITEDQFNHYLEQGAHPLLTARAMYQAANQLKTHYLYPLIKPELLDDVRRTDTVTADSFIERVYPDQHIHAQTSGRWSTVKPALPTLPESLRAMLIPDPGYAFLSFDKDQIELRLSAAISKDIPTLEAFEQEYDIHTLNTCDFFKYDYAPDKKDPHTAPENAEWRKRYNWEGKGDQRRVFSKGFVYRLRYRGEPGLAGDVPGAKTLGLGRTDLIGAARNYLNAHPSLVPYWNKLDADILKTRRVRSPWGRLRYMNGSAKPEKAGGVPKICREGSNHPFQAGTSDHFNDLLLRIWERGKPYGLSWVYGAHDSQKYMVPIEHVPECLAIIQEENDVPMMVNGKPLHLPGTPDKVVMNDGQGLTKVPVSVINGKWVLT